METITIVNGVVTISRPGVTNPVSFVRSGLVGKEWVRCIHGVPFKGDHEKAAAAFAA
jgi:hypothetical protein